MISAPLPTKAVVSSYFADIPIMVRIADCESDFTQYEDDGSVLKGYIDPDDTGVFQINRYYNGLQALKMGYDIGTLSGNLAMARWMYNEYGTQPWKASKACWSRYA